MTTKSQKYSNILITNSISLLRKMGWFKSETIDFSKEKNEKEDLAKSIKLKKSCYIHDYRSWEQGSKESNLILNSSGDKYLIEVDFKEEVSGRGCKPLYDYDFLIFDSSSELSSTQSEELNKAIQLKIPIIVLSGSYYKKENIYGEIKELKKCSFLDLLAKKYFNFRYTFVSATGRDANIKDSTFKLWWDCIKTYYLTFSNLPEDSRIMAVNRANIPISWYYDNITFIPSHDRGYLNQSPYGDYDKGFLIRKEYFSKLISFLVKFKPTPKLPEWFNDFLILNEKELIKKRELINSDLKEVQDIKKVIATDGTELQNTFAYILDLLKIKWEKIGTEDYLIKGEPHIIVEITGTKNNLNGEKAIQSLKHREVLRGKIKGEFKSRVIINHQKEKIPDKRNQLDNHTIKEFYEKHNICVMSTISLLKYFQKIINNKIAKDDFLKLIISTSGELK